MRTLSVLALATLLVLAGCNAPAGPGTATEQAPTETATPRASPTASPTETPGGHGGMTLDGTTPVTEAPSERPPVRVRSGSLPAGVDANETLARVETITGRDVGNLDLVVVEPQPASVEYPDGFFEAVGFEPARPTFLEVTGQYDDESITVRVSENASRVEVEAVLVHEFAHAAESTRDQSFRYNDDFRGLDGRFAALATIEGPAVYVTDAYLARHAEAGANQTETFRAAVEDGSPYAAYFSGHYYFGAQYVRSRVDSPRNLSELYLNPPYTSEQVLHGYAPWEEERADLSVPVRTGDDWYVRTVDGYYGDRTTAGEALIRYVLQTELERSTANAAAAGWGNDSVVALSDGNSSGYVWVLRWDTAADAEEFAAAFRTYRERGGGNVSAWRLERFGDRTTVVVGGEEALLDAVSVSADGADVNVTVGHTSSTDRVAPPGSNSAATESPRR
jgi:hypothetical protein